MNRLLQVTGQVQAALASLAEDQPDVQNTLAKLPQVVVVGSQASSEVYTFCSMLYMQPRSPTAVVSVFTERGKKHLVGVLHQREVSPHGSRNGHQEAYHN